MNDLLHRLSIERVWSVVFALAAAAVILAVQWFGAPLTSVPGVSDSAAGVSAR